VVGAVDEHIDATRCGGQHNCQDDLQCLTHDLWEELSNKITNFLDSVSLADMVEKQTIKQISQRQDVVMTRMEVQ
jgi:Rrf2 family iron-sulfur cluster assembly transcriptional regulator